MNVFVLLNTKEDILKNVGNRAVLGTIDFHSIFSLLWKSMVPQNSLVTNFLQNIFLCVRQNKDIHTGLELLEGEKMMTRFSFLGELSLYLRIMCILIAYWLFISIHKAHINALFCMTTLRSLNPTPSLNVITTLLLISSKLGFE